MEDEWVLKIRNKTLHKGTLVRAVLSVSRTSQPHVNAGSIVLSGDETSNLLALFAMQSNCTLLDLSLSRGIRRCRDEWRDAHAPEEKTGTRGTAST